MAVCRDCVWNPAKRQLAASTLRAKHLRCIRRNKGKGTADCDCQHRK